MPKLRQRKPSKYIRKKDKKSITVNPVDFDLKITAAIAAACGWNKGDEIVIIPGEAKGSATCIKIQA